MKLIEESKQFEFIDTRYRVTVNNRCGLVRIEKQIPERWCRKSHWVTIFCGHSCIITDIADYINETKEPHGKTP